MQRTPVTSSNVVSIGYDAAGQRLEVEYKGGKVYTYAEVPAETHRDLLAAESKGSFIARQIKPTFACTPGGFELGAPAGEEQADETQDQVEDAG